MEYKTLIYDMNRPSPQQVTEPLDSDYGLAVKVYKDGQYLSLGQDEMTVNGVSATSQYDGYNVYELKSGSVPTTRSYALDIQAKPTVDTILTKSGIGEPKSSSSGYYLDIKPSLAGSSNMPLSGYGLPDTITFNWVGSIYTDMSRYRIVKESGVGEWQPYSVVFSIKGILDGRAGTYMVLHDSKGEWHWYFRHSDDYTDRYIGDSLTLNTSTDYFFLYGNRVRVTDPEPFSAELQIRCRINTNDGFTNRYDFLRVQEKDLGYIEF